MSTVQFDAPPDVCPRERFRELVLQAAETGSYNPMAAQAATFNLGLNPSDFHVAVSRAGQRRQAATDREAADAARDRLQAHHAERAALVARLEAQQAELTAAYEAACRALGDELASHDHEPKRANAIAQANAEVARGARAHDLLLATADKSIDARLAEIDRRLHSLQVDGANAVAASLPRARRETEAGESANAGPMIEDREHLSRIVAAAEAVAANPSQSDDVRQAARGRALVAQGRLARMNAATRLGGEIDVEIAALQAEADRLRRKKLDWRCIHLDA